MKRLAWAIFIAVLVVGSAHSQPYPYSDHYGPYGPRGRGWGNFEREYRGRWDPPAMYPAPRWRGGEYPEYRGWRGGPPRMWMYGRPYREY
jgi:hypothetical protein